MYFFISYFSTTSRAQHISWLFLEIFNKQAQAGSRFPLGYFDLVWPVDPVAGKDQTESLELRGDIDNDLDESALLTSRDCCVYLLRCKVSCIRRGEDRKRVSCQSRQGF
jgi:hypothetical protein